MYSGVDRDRRTSGCSGMFRWFVILVLFWATPLHAERPVGTPSLEAFASLPRLLSIQLSPSGRYLAVLRNEDGQSLLVTQTVAGQDPHVVATTDNRDDIINWFTWANDERLLVSVRFAATPGRVESQETRLLAVNRDGSQQKPDLLKSASFLFGPKHVPQFQDRIIGDIPDDSRHVLMQLDIERPNSPDVYKVDVYTGERTIVETNPGLHPGDRNVLNWVVDREGKVRAGVGQSRTSVRVIVKPPGTDSWRDFADYDLAKETGPYPLGFDEDPRWLYVRDMHRGRASIFKVDTADPAADRILVATDPKSDLMGDLVYSRWRRKVVGVRYGAEDQRVLFWDFDAQRLQARVDRALAGRTNIVHSTNGDGHLHIVKAGGVAHPPEWYLFDERDGHVVKLGDAYAGLSELRPILPEPVRVLARDGKELPVLVTKPRGLDGLRVPMVVYPHGGLFQRDSTGFDPWTQWFVSQGWMVLQVGFRGVGGFGNDFLHGGFQRWGLEMQDDLTDSVQWAVRQGFADPRQICIVGANYGGYAALMGVVRTPELYRCAVSLGAVTDLLQLVGDSRWYLNRKDVSEARIGSWWGDRERLRDTSPIAHAKEIRTPLLLLHGEADRLIPVSHSRDLAAALKAGGIESFRYVELPQADHRLNTDDARLQVFQELDRFLHQYLD